MKKLSNTEAELKNSIAYKRKRVAPFKNTYLRKTALENLCSKNCSTFLYFRPKLLIKNHCLFFFLKKKHEKFKWIMANKLRKSLQRKNILFLEFLSMYYCFEINLFTILTIFHEASVWSKGVIEKENLPTYTTFLNVC